MQISINADALVKQLENLFQETVSKMENMVRGWAYEVSLTAIGKTPLGDNSPEPIGNYESYALREQEYGLKPIPGLARGGWQAKPSGGLVFQEIYDPNQALSGVKSSMASYKLGQDVWIGNKGPYITALENNWSPQTNGEGIMKPTLQSIEVVYKSDFTKYYK